jgi:hypothetical protein
MKNLHLRLSTVALALMISIVACKKDNDSPGESAKFSATISGTAFQPSVVAAVEEWGFITITGLQIKNGDSLALSLDIPDTAHVNTPFDFDAGGLFYIKSKGDIAYWSWNYPSHGTTTLTTWDKTNKKIAGTYSGVIYTDDSKDSIVVSNGKFNTTYK